MPTGLVPNDYLESDDFADNIALICSECRPTTKSEVYMIKQECGHTKGCLMFPSSPSIQLCPNFVFQK